MRRSWIVWCAVASLMAGCTAASPPQPPGSTSSTFGTDERLGITCNSLDGTPPVQLSSLAEVWAYTNYLRFAGCTAKYIGPRPFMPTAEEAGIIDVARTAGYTGQDPSKAYFEAVEVCARVSDETGPQGFPARGLPILEAAAALCPGGPQGKIILAWATGARIADGSYEVGATMQAGTFRTVMPKNSDGIHGCSWKVSDATGAAIAEGSEAFTSSPLEVKVANDNTFASENCGIWQKTD
jgi:hypothetical protein